MYSNGTSLNVALFILKANQWLQQSLSADLINANLSQEFLRQYWGIPSKCYSPFVSRITLQLIGVKLFHVELPFL